VLGGLAECFWYIKTFVFLAESINMFSYMHFFQATMLYVLYQLPSDI
jgi:hypothetical protein